jgi:hypothetical protein
MRTPSSDIVLEAIALFPKRRTLPMKKLISAFCPFASLFLFVIPAGAQFAQLYTVNTTQDTVVAGASINGAADCSLRGALEAANSVSDNVIRFSIPEFCPSSGCVINLTQALPDISTGQERAGGAGGGQGGAGGGQS